jgi:hypothetical protein
MKKFSRAVVTAALLVSPAVGAPAWAQALLTAEVEQFIKEKLKFGGFAENTTGLTISHGSHFFDTSNRFVMNRLTIQPEFNATLKDDLNFLVSWRFVKEPRYSPNIFFVGP